MESNDKTYKHLKLFFLVFSNIVNGGNSLANGLEYRQSEVLNSRYGHFGVLEWTVNYTESLISFKLTKNATSPNIDIVLGLSKTCSVKDADLVRITGYSDSTYKASSMYGTDTDTIEPTSKELWSLNSVKSEGENIIVSISRKLDNCQLSLNRSFCPTNDMVHILWGSGKGINSESEYSKMFIPEGSIRAFLTDPQIVSPLLKNYDDTQTWRISQKYRMAVGRMTSYRCNIYKAPNLSSRHHIIGYVPHFANSNFKKHIHHQLLYRCSTPPGIKAFEIFDHLLDHPGYDYLENNYKLPSLFCTELIYGYGLGGKSYFLPEHVGIPLGETRDEYFLLETHYDNPELIDDLVIENGVDILYTSKIRQKEGSMFIAGYGHLGLYMVPPNSIDFKIGGICSSDCTRDMLTGKGATNILGANLHAHKTTHKMSLRHFRGSSELATILNDNNYDASFQQLRYVQSQVEIMPGDQLGVECVVNTENRTILSGLSTKNDMCLVFILLDNRINYLFCSSEYPTKTTLRRYGIQKVGWDKELHERVIMKANRHSGYVGKTLQSLVDKEVKWTEETKRDLEIEQMYSKHKKICPSAGLLNTEGISIYKQLLEFKNVIPSPYVNRAPVNTPGFMGEYTEWRNLNKTHYVVHRR